MGEPLGDPPRRRVASIKSGNPIPMHVVGTRRMLEATAKRSSSNPSVGLSA